MAQRMQRRSVAHATALGFAALFVASTAAADERASHFRLATEVDPLPFFMHGYSVHAAWKPDVAARLRFTLGAFGFRQETTGTNSGFETRVDAFETSAVYYPFSGFLRGLFGGLYVFEQRYRYTRSDTPGEALRHWITPAPAIGFQWLPWGRGPYLTPWAALGIPIKRTGSTRIGTHDYEEPSVVPVLALHIGWELEL